MKKIAVFGTHGAAKTTLVYKLAAYYKMLDKNAIVIHETARQSPFPINTDAVYQTTLFVVTSQIKKELEAEAQGFDIAISDRTPSDAFVYINHLERDNLYTRSLETFCMEWIKKFHALIYLEPSEGYAISEDGTRATDENYQKLIRDDFRLLVEDIEEKYKDSITLIKAESSQIFDENQCQLLMQEINRSVYEQHRDFHVV